MKIEPVHTDNMVIEEEPMLSSSSKHNSSRQYASQKFNENQRIESLSDEQNSMRTLNKSKKNFMTRKVSKNPQLLYNLVPNIKSSFQRSKVPSPYPITEKTEVKNSNCETSTHENVLSEMEKIQTFIYNFRNNEQLTNHESLYKMTDSLNDKDLQKQYNQLLSNFHEHLKKYQPSYERQNKVCADSSYNKNRNQIKNIFMTLRRQRLNKGSYKSLGHTKAVTEASTHKIKSSM